MAAHATWGQDRGDGALGDFSPSGAPPERRRVGDWAYEQLRSVVFEGGLRPGDRLSVPALADKLQVSRSPVREAVARLVAEGLAKEVPHKGAVVAAYGAAELASVYEVREVLEGLAARLAAERMDEDSVEALSETLELHREGVRRGDQRTHLEEDARFHALIRTAAGHAWLSSLLDQIRGRVLLAMLSTSLGGGPEQAVAEHQRIFEAIKARDSDAAEAAARDHVRRLRESLRRLAAHDEGDA